MFMTPDDKIQESGQVALSDAVFGILGMRDSVLMQNKHIEPLILGAIWAACRSGPALTHTHIHMKQDNMWTGEKRQHVDR